MTNNKFNYVVEIDSVGEWDGDEKYVASKFQELADIIADNTEIEEEFNEAMSNVWNDLGADHPDWNPTDKAKSYY